MAKVIDFYIPDSFYNKVKRMPAEQRGKVIEIKVTKTTNPNETSELSVHEPSRSLV